MNPFIFILSMGALALCVWRTVEVIRSLMQAYELGPYSRKHTDNHIDDRKENPYE